MGLVLYSKLFLFIMIHLLLSFGARGSVALKTLKQNYKDHQIEKKTLQLSDKDIQVLEKKTRLKITQKKYTVFQIKKKSFLQALAVIQTVKIRSKRAVLLHIFTKEKDSFKLKNIEILSFNEPIEYKPKKHWLSLFFGQTLAQLRKNIQDKDIPILTGATLSSYSFFKTSLIAGAIINLKKVSL